MRNSCSNKRYNILIINRFFVSLQCKAGVFVFVMAGWLMAVDGHAQTSSASPFNTIGEGYRKRLVKLIDHGEGYRQHPAKDSDLGEPSDTIDAADVLQPPADSLRAYLPMVALPLRRISVSSPFGLRMDPMDRRRRRMHSGLDLKAHYEPVFSMLPGTVVAASYSIKGGYYVTINHGSFVCSYLHLSKILASAGQRVTAGQPIAISGNTGRNTTGPYLHISCRWGDTKGKYFDPTLILEYITTQLTNK
jgi:murein DD-endopeptidase MepM/ murein hydrolase activator NlpD